MDLELHPETQDVEPSLTAKQTVAQESIAR